MGAWRNNFSGPSTIILKALFLYNNSTRNSLLIHGFWPVNARLLIAYGTAFYAIIYGLLLHLTYNSREHVMFLSRHDPLEL